MTGGARHVLPAAEDRIPEEQPAERHLVRSAWIIRGARVAAGSASNRRSMRRPLASCDRPTDAKNSRAPSDRSATLPRISFRMATYFLK